MTYKQLKELLSSLDDAQLNQDISVRYMNNCCSEMDYVYPTILLICKEKLYSFPSNNEKLYTEEEMKEFSVNEIRKADIELAEGEVVLICKHDY